MVCWLHGRLEILKTGECQFEPIFSLDPFMHLILIKSKIIISQGNQENKRRNKEENSNRRPNNLSKFRTQCDTNKVLF